MVRERRKCAKGRMKPVTEALEDPPPDAPKKKDSKLSKEFQGKLSHASPQIKSPLITSFFSPRECKVSAPDSKADLAESFDKETSDSPVSGASTRNESTEASKSDDGEEKSVVKSAGRSPHAIQLCEDMTPLSPSSALSKLCISLSPKRAVRSRRRLNPSQAGNQLSAPKSVCCNSVSAAPVRKVPGNHQLTEYFPVRRSVRKTKTTVLEEQQRDLQEAVLSQREDGLEVVHNFEGKGRGIVTTRHFSKGEFVVEYAGELIDMCKAKEREKSYAQDQNTGCYMYYFKYRNTQYCVDATAESGRLGRLVNHSRSGNLITKTVSIMNRPHLVLIAKEDIPAGEEVMYDYGDRSKESIRYHPWLAM